MIIAVTNQKGGCAKTTTAINLAASLASLGKRTLLIDLDPQAHATLGLGIKPDQLEISMYNALSDRPDQKHFIENVIQPFSAGFDIAPADVLLSTIEQEFVERDQAVGRLKKVISQMAFPYEYVVIDCPPSLGFLTFNALFAADIALVPIELGTFSMMGVAKLLSMIELIRVKMQYAPRAFAVATMVDLRSRFSRDMLARIQQAFQDNMMDTHISMNVACRESQQLGIPVIDHNKESKSAKDYVSLAKEVVLSLNQWQNPSDDAIVSESRGRVRDFSFMNDAAKQVYLVGDFNNWKIDQETQLWDQGRGVWQKRLLLKPGRYRYKYVVDGQWISDPQNQLAEPNAYGGIDSIIEIG